MTRLSNHNAVTMTKSQFEIALYMLHIEEQTIQYLKGKRVTSFDRVY